MSQERLEGLKRSTTLLGGYEFAERGPTSARAAQRKLALAVASSTTGPGASKGTARDAVLIECQSPDLE